NKSSQKTVQDELPGKIRFKFSKTGTYKYFSHLDIISIISRAIRRAKIRVKYSEGFNPKPKMSFGPPTPLGIESHAEYGDIILADDLEPEDFLIRLNNVLYDRLRIEKAVRTSSAVKSIMSQTDIIKYSIYSDRSNMGKEKNDILNNLPDLLDENEQISRGIYRFEEVENGGSGSQVVLNLFGYAKILKGIESKVFKFGEFRIFLEGVLKEHGIDNIKIIKEELYIMDGERLINPFEILK
ncbi:MAG: TIGR03936 family radical SAM-associated protein, partial [Candidatus Humimicrobiaceae bacterium]